jgi:hypothetical protein
MVDVIDNYQWKEIKISAKLRFNEIGIAFFKIDATARGDSTSMVVS